MFHKRINLLGGGGAKDPSWKKPLSKTYLRLSIEKMHKKNVHIVTRKTVQRASWYHLLVAKCIHSQLTAEMTQEDPDIQILLDHAKDLYSSLLRGKMTLADDTCYAILIKLERAT